MKSKTLRLMNTLFEQVDPSQVQGDNIAPDATSAQDTEHVSSEITSNQIVNLATIMRDFLANVSQFGTKLDGNEITKISNEQITPENAMQKIEEFSRLASGKQPDMGVNISVA